jgi:hypothetical protein
MAENKILDDEFTMIRVKVSTRDRLKRICPAGLQFQYFATEFIENALDHREILEECVR